jgi:copper chaperone CopZ
MATNNNNETVYIPLEDVESEHCALIVEKGLAKVDGVETQKVETFIPRTNDSWNTETHLHLLCQETFISSSSSSRNPS